MGVNDNTFSRIEIMKAQNSKYLHFHNSGRNHFTSNCQSLLSLPLSAFTEKTIFFQSFSNSFNPTSCCLACGSKGSRYLIKYSSSFLSTPNAIIDWPLLNGTAQGKTKFLSLKSSIEILIRLASSFFSARKAFKSLKGFGGSSSWNFFSCQTYSYSIFLKVLGLILVK